MGDIAVDIATALGSGGEPIEHVIDVALTILPILRPRRGAGASRGCGARAACPGEAIQPIITERLVVRALGQRRVGAGDVAQYGCTLGNRWFTG